MPLSKNKLACGRCKHLKNNTHDSPCWYCSRLVDSTKIYDRWTSIYDLDKVVKG